MFDPKLQESCNHFIVTSSTMRWGRVRAAAADLKAGGIAVQTISSEQQRSKFQAKAPHV